jgi:hypothetical protein
VAQWYFIGATARHGDGFGGSMSVEMIGWGAAIEQGNPDHLVVFISGFGRPEHQQFHFAEFSQRFRQTKLFLRDHTSTQYMDGIKGVTDTPEENVEFLRYMIDKLAPQRVSFVSGSVGSHPTVLWGLELGVTDIHLIGPVTDLGAMLRTERATQQGFLPLTDHVNNLVAQGYPHLSLRPFMEQNWQNTDLIDVYYGLGDHIDSAQAGYIEDIPNVRSTVYHQGNHFRVPAWVQRRDPDLENRINGPLVRPADLRASGQTDPIELGYAAVRLK